MTTLSNIFENDQMQIITSEFTRLGERCYLDNAGATLYPQCLLKNINEDLLNNVYINPHSDKYTQDCIEQIRYHILSHFNTDSSTYSVVFTSGTTQSLKLVGESFQFAPDENEVLNCGSLVYLRDNHTSVVGLREIAAEKNVDIIHISHEDFLKALDPTKVSLPTNGREKYKNEGNTLLVYPAQSNFNGYKYPINCMDIIKKGCLNQYIKKQLCKINCSWYVLLDAACYVSTSKLDLSVVQPDFVCLSFYKVFGYPTGLGALLIKNSSANVLNQKKYFGGGTVDIVLSSEDFHVKRKILHERFEDGTLPFLSIIALKHCFDALTKLIPKIINNDIMDTISHHTYSLAKDLYHQLGKLHHENGNKAVITYMDTDFTDISKQGAIVTFNLLREDGTYIGYSEFQHMADLFNISIRTGCFCNSGSCQRHLNASNKEMKDMYNAGHKCGDDVDLIDGKPTGAIRVSFGYYNTFNDVDKLIVMICRCFVRTKYNKPKRTMNDFIKLKSLKYAKNISSEENHKINEEEFFEEKYSTIQQPLIKSDIVLSQISLFPIKSCGAFKINTSWKIGSKGFEYDREWMIIKDNGVCLTQKQNTRMCMIRPKIDLKRKVMILYFKGLAPISVPLNPLENKHKEVTICQSKVCTDLVKGYDCGDEVANWISNALEISFLRLVKQASHDGRVQKTNTDEDKKLLSLSNQAQFLLINKATVRWLNDKIQEPLFMEDIEQLTDRFRGNLIINMDEELVERDWQRVIIGKHEFRVDGQCPRCQMVCIDQQTGEKTVEPLRTISEQFAGKMRFGIYLSYMGPIDGSREHMLKINAPVKPIINDEDISR
ncbi:molybdenum cofactor sulfurase [Galleria mellonella]|uniref:Molybdenum cofactor sulfurase n=1 Tax=Galleria mellonella TaxID=7137 RepID=A0A6J1WKY5_GALME|nr:molybdenum cofactor sulfurase [Galleria mellonella]XP_031766516.2 molybdenum cofactor sulfurase [Galleria mellonella]